MSSFPFPIAQNLVHRSGSNQLTRREFVKLSATALAAAGVGLNCAHTLQRPVGDASERDLVLLAIDEAQRAGADFADARISQHWYESIGTREERITNVSSTNSYGMGVRALVGGSFGFSATRELTRDAVAATARQAVAIAAANNRVAPSIVTMAPVKAYPNAQWQTPHEIDPFTIPIE
jgi:TldD protein